METPEPHTRGSDELIIELVRSVAALQAQMTLVMKSIENLHQDMKELTDAMAVDKCKDCEVRKDLDKHLESHEKTIDRGWVVTGLGFSVLLGIISLVVQFTGK